MYHCQMMLVKIDYIILYDCLHGGFCFWLCLCRNVRSKKRLENFNLNISKLINTLKYLNKKNEDY